MTKKMNEYSVDLVRHTILDRRVVKASSKEEAQKIALPTFEQMDIKDYDDVWVELQEEDLMEVRKVFWGDYSTSKIDDNNGLVYGLESTEDFPDYVEWFESEEVREKYIEDNEMYLADEDNNYYIFINGEISKYHNKNKERLEIELNDLLVHEDNQEWIKDKHFEIKMR